MSGRGCGHLGLGRQVEEEQFGVEGHQPNVNAFRVRGQRLGHDLPDGIDRNMLRAKESIVHVRAKVREFERLIKSCCLSMNCQPATHLGAYHEAVGHRSMRNIQHEQVVGIAFHALCDGA